MRFYFSFSFTDLVLLGSCTVAPTAAAASMMAASDSASPRMVADDSFASEPIGISLVQSMLTLVVTRSRTIRTTVSMAERAEYGLSDFVNSLQEASGVFPSKSFGSRIFPLVSGRGSPSRHRNIPCCLADEISPCGPSHSTTVVEQR